MNQKVSVVVPIYKVERYLSKCVDSILNQTYRNLEVILVNDGSPDDCGNIAENYALLDNRVKVIHKENGGLSDARNYGMKYVTGEYTLFVDSDDWLDRSMIEELVKTSSKFQAEVVQSAFYYAYNDHLLFDSRVYKQNASPVVLDNKSLMYELVKNNIVKNFAWGKLYKTKIIKDIPFKKGVLFEDVFWAHQVMQGVKTFVCVNKPFYFYLQRADSIVGTYTPRNLDILEGLKERHRFIEKYYENLTAESYKALLKNNLIHYILLLRNRKKDRNGLYRKEIFEYIKGNYSELKKATVDDKLLKKQLIMFNIHPYLYTIFLVFQKVLRKIRFLPQPIGLERRDL
ncbi:glycosyltransferase involved in cell wall biosynthesis [Neobacillus niacini]|uniref:glycosyltransferase family 2 protein n=1 Tax=Neobacillus driksii TaxID=3035913 RepID=UPI00277E56CF|nr:glycosyltransferase family 2 protein [Neobacillus niacini]MDQ0975373.1 glycosyltransferase involved in cell wall biosynthesis [Neobacillus niacini]